MNHVELRTRILDELYARRKASSDDVGAIEVAKLASTIGDSATKVASVCSNLVLHGHVDSDHNTMGFVRISDTGMTYYEDVQEMNE